MESILKALVYTILYLEGVWDKLVNEGNCIRGVEGRGEEGGRAGALVSGVKEKPFRNELRKCSSKYVFHILVFKAL